MTNMSLMTVATVRVLFVSKMARPNREEFHFTLSEDAESNY